MKRDERSARHDNWTCMRCIESLQASPERPLPDLEKSFEDVASQMKTTTKDSLRLLQWNADGLKSKIDELAPRLDALKIDIALIQETKLSKTDRTPYIKGFKSVREDRKANIRGGGLITYIRDSLIYEIVDRRHKKATEILTIRVRLNRSKWVTATNLYCPPVNSTGQEISLELSSIPKAASSIICGDFNAHHPIWDFIQPEDDRGTDIVEWAHTNSLAILNDDSVTRNSRVTGRGSSPDLTICGSVWENKCNWSVDDVEIGGSDHLPVIINVSTTTKHQPIMGRAPKWRSNGVLWDDFRSEVDQSLTGVSPDVTLKARITRFRDAVISAAKIHVRKVKPGKQSKSWMTPKVRRLVKHRNILRKSIGTKRKEWLAACTEVSSAKREARETQWKEVVSSALGDLDERSMWRFIKSLNGTPDSNSPNEVMDIGGKKITSNKKKADLFSLHYAGVNKLKFSRQERRAYNLRLKRLLSSKDGNAQAYPEFTMSELKNAIKKMRRKGAPGPDDIPPSFLKELGPIALEELLAISNLSLNLAEVPQEWMDAIIIPLLKASKPPSDLASYRPVSLTSCVAKVLERMVADRLYCEAESKGWFASIQAGFRRGHSCADQILRISQAIEDGFQQREMNRSVLILLDYSKAFDTVWRERLLLSMHEKGVPLQVIRWIYGFLKNRQARVRLHEELSSSRRLNQGLPQGCVLSPLLFLFFINNLAELLMKDNPELAAKLVFSLFADDVTILATHRKREEAVKAAQWAVNLVNEWSAAWKLNLNASKSEVGYFTRWTKEIKSEWKPELQIAGKAIPYNSTPKLLGVFLDTQLSFVKQTKEAAKAATAKIKIISAVANTDWGWKKDELKKLYFSYVRSKLDYASPAWQPWLSPSNIKVLDTVQNKALRAITGQLRNTASEALRYETRVTSYKTRIERTCLRSMEMARRLPDDHPRRLALENGVEPRNDYGSWYKLGSSLTTRYIPPEAESRMPIHHPKLEPWLDLEHLSIRDQLEGISSRTDDAESIRKAAAAVISQWNGDVTIFTDGSAVGGYRDGGSAAVIHMHDDPPRVEYIRIKGASFTTSFEEEGEALMSAAKWIRDNCDYRTRVIILTDSQSYCKALMGADSGPDDLRRVFADCASTIRLQWIPGHCGIDGNEEADAAANEARVIQGERRPTSYRSISSAINQLVPDTPCRPEQQHIAQIYSNYSARKEAEIKTRWDQVYLARLRGGQHWDLRHFQHRVNNNVTPTCPRCGFEEETIQHWIQCPGTMAMKQRIFGDVEVDLSVLTAEPSKSIALARGTLRGAEKPSTR